MSSEDTTGLVVTLVLSVAAAGVMAWLLYKAVLSLRHRRALHEAERASRAREDGKPETARRLAAVVVNPSKVREVGPMREAITRALEASGWQEPLWLETTKDDSGTAMTREALDAGAELVLVCGGDGTVRCVGQVLAGTGVPMGLVPAGTGNLLARNLDIVTPRTAELTPGDAETATRVALAGEDRAVDVGWVTLTSADGADHDTPSERGFLVMAGMGFDAAMIANAPEKLKAKVGPAAYVVSGLQHFQGKRAKVRLDLDGTVHHRRVRTVVVGNVGRLIGGLTLLPDAEVDDGWLDVVSIGPSNFAGWLDVAGRVVLRHRRSDSRLESWRARSVTLTCDPPQHAQIDGDPVGEVTGMTLRVSEGALLVRVAPGSGAKEARADEKGRAVQATLEEAPG